MKNGISLSRLLPPIRILEDKAGGRIASTEPKGAPVSGGDTSTRSEFGTKRTGGLRARARFADTSEPAAHVDQIGSSACIYMR